MSDLSAVLWIGGGTGAGKSSVARALAEKYALERHNDDWHDARDHSARMDPDRHPVRSAFLAMSLDDQWVNRSPSQMAEAEIAEFAERFEMVLEDLAALRGSDHRGRVRTRSRSHRPSRSWHEPTASPVMHCSRITVRQRASALGFATIDVDGTRSLVEISAEVEQHFAPLLP